MGTMSYSLQYKEAYIGLLRRQGSEVFTYRAIKRGEWVLVAP